MADNTYVVEYAKTGRAKCKDTKCKKIIAKGALRIGKVAPRPEAFGGDGEDTMTVFYHAPCMFNALTRARKTTKRIESQDDLEGFSDVKSSDQSKLLAWMKSPPAVGEGIDDGDAAAGASAAGTKKRKKASSTKASNGTTGNGGVFDGLSICVAGTMSLKRDAFHELLEANGAIVAKSVTKKCTHVVASVAEIGKATAKVTKAKDANVPLVSEQWVHDSVSAGKVKDVKAYDASKAEPLPKQKRATSPKKKAKKTAAAATKTAASGGTGAFANCYVCVSGTLSMKRAEFAALLTSNGAVVVGGVTKKCTHVVTTADEVAKATAKIQKAETNGVPMVTEDWVHASISSGSLVPTASYSP